jgi:hypothetical protein
MAPSRSSGIGSSSTVREVSVAAAVTEKAVEMRTAEEVTTVKAAEEAATVKVAADKATTEKVARDKAVVEKVAADKATVMKAAMEAMAKVSTDAVAVKTAGQGATAPRTTTGLVGSRSDSSPGPAARSKRVTTLSGSTPPSKRFRGGWKSGFAEQLCSRHLPFILFVLYLIEFFVDQHACHWRDGARSWGSS